MVCTPSKKGVTGYMYTPLMMCVPMGCAGAGGAGGVGGVGGGGGGGGAEPF